MTTTTSRRPTKRRQRSMQRTAHLIAGVLLLAQLYAAPWLGSWLTVTAQWLVGPLVVASGIAMWKGHRIRRFLRGRAARHA
ncbi:MAG: hypothetical protein WA966_02595 [Ornithinimicrobium sp.]